MINMSDLKKIDFKEYEKIMKKEIKDIGYEEILIRMAWSLTKIMNDNKIK